MLREIRTDQKEQRQHGQSQNPDLRNRRVSTRRKHQVSAAWISVTTKPLERHYNQRHAASECSQQRRRHGASLQRRLAQQAEVHHQHQQRGNLQGRLRQHHAKEFCVVHRIPPASSALTAGSIESSSTLGYTPTIS